MNPLTLAIGQALAKEIDGFKFSKSRSCLVKSTEVGWQAIAVEALPTATQGIAKLAVHGQIRIDALELIYTPHHPFLDLKEVAFHPTITINFDTLLGNKSLAHGFPTDSASVERFVREYGAAIKCDLAPWLETYSSEQALYDGLINQDPKKWITSDRLTRYPVLLAILAQRRDWKVFDLIVAEFSAYCNQRHALVYKPLAEAVTRMRKQ